MKERRTGGQNDARIATDTSRYRSCRWIFVRVAWAPLTVGGCHESVVTRAQVDDTAADFAGAPRYCDWRGAAAAANCNRTFRSPENGPTPDGMPRSLPPTVARKEVG